MFYAMFQHQTYKSWSGGKNARAESAR